MGVFVKRIKVFPLGCTLARGDIPRMPVSTVVCPFPFGCILARGDIFDLCKRGILSSTENESVLEFTVVVDRNGFVVRECLKVNHREKGTAHGGREGDSKIYHSDYFKNISPLLSMSSHFFTFSINLYTSLLLDTHIDKMILKL